MTENSNKLAGVRTEQTSSDEGISQNIATMANLLDGISNTGDEISIEPIQQASRSIYISFHYYIALRHNPTGVCVDISAKAGTIHTSIIKTLGKNPVNPQELRKLLDKYRSLLTDWRKNKCGRGIIS